MSQLKELLYKVLKFNDINFLRLVYRFRLCKTFDKITIVFDAEIFTQYKNIIVLKKSNWVTNRNNPFEYYASLDQYEPILTVYFTDNEPNLTMNFRISESDMPAKIITKEKYLFLFKKNIEVDYIDRIIECEYILKMGHLEEIVSLEEGNKIIKSIIDQHQNTLDLAELEKRKNTEIKLQNRLNFLK